MQRNLDFDRHHIWHPYSSVEFPGPLFEVVSAEGVMLTLADGRELVDGMSSWWAAIHDYNVDALNRAVSAQLQSMAHVMFGGLTHQPAVDLARRLVELTAPGLNKVFFADSGSVAVEVALKMALQYWQAQGNPSRNRLMTVRGGYHGDTFATMALSDPDGGMHRRFSSMMNQPVYAPAPPDPIQWATYDAAELQQLFECHHQQLAAVVLEPVVQGAGGMRIYAPGWLLLLRELCDRYGVLLILDEIATGFGRTGTLFAYQQAGIEPDILCLGKALTGGYMTLAATIASDQVARGIAADGAGVLMHGPTFMANPLACSCALASIDLLLNSPWQPRVARIEHELRQGLVPCGSSELVKEVRVKGAIGVVELTRPVDMGWIQPRLVELGVWVRPFGRLLYLMPPFVIESGELERLTFAICAVVDEMAKRCR